MKQIYLLFVAIFAMQIVQSQIVTIPDANFKNALVNIQCVDTDGNNYPDSDVDTNNDGEIQISEAESVTNLSLVNRSISSLIGIEYFTNLTVLKCNSNQLTNLDLSSLLNLEWLDCGGNQLTSIDLPSTSSLKRLWCSGNQLTDLDITQLPNLTYLICSYNNLTSIDNSNNTLLNRVKCDYNQLTNLDITNLTELYSLNCINNQLTMLDTSQNLELGELFCNNNSISSLDLQNNIELRQLRFSENQISTINLQNNSNLWSLYCDNNQLTYLDLTNNPNLSEVYCNNNLISTIEFNNLQALEELYCNDNSLENLDFSQCPILKKFDCSNNQLLSLNVKNGFANYSGEGASPFDLYVFNFGNNPNLKYICTDDIIPLTNYNTYNESNYVQSRVNNYGYTNCAVNSYCSFVPGGEFFIIQGQTKLDLNTDGCDLIDNTYPNLKFDITDGSTNGSVISDASGNYNIPVQQGTHTLTPVFENTNYFTISPSSVSVTFPTETSSFTQDFCISPNGSYNDLEVSVLPIDQARPGFDTRYKIFYKNKGTTTLSGTVDLTFQDEVMDLVSANPIVDSQTIDNLSWNYSNLLPFESREILVTMNLNTPTDTPPLNGGDSLGFAPTVNPVTGDETMEDNTFQLKQTVINSYDPNDKTCLEGNTITPDLIGEYVNYLIRFENTGTANAINVVVKDIIDTAKFDLSTLFLTDSSHDLVTRINGNKVEFIFENINLPFDDANNDGYIAFKIKTLNTLVEGDAFENDAEIYFDYNFPIQTNVAQTSIESPLSTDDFELSGFEVYPNPSQNTLFIKGLDAIKSVSIYDMSGRLVNEVSLIGTRNNIDISTEKLGQGAYFVKVKTEVGEFVKKVVKE